MGPDCAPCIKNALAAVKRELKKNKEKSGAGTSSALSKETKVKALTHVSSEEQPVPAGMKSTSNASGSDVDLPSGKPTSIQVGDTDTEQQWLPLRPFNWDDFLVNE